MLLLSLKPGITLPGLHLTLPFPGSETSEKLPTYFGCQNSTLENGNTDTFLVED